MAATSTCLENIEKMNPSVYCGDAHCEAVQKDVDQYCYNSGQPKNTPIPQMTSGGQTCWCCCGQPAELAVNIGDGMYRRAGDLAVGDRVLVTGRDVSGWRHAEIAGLASPEATHSGLRLTVMMSGGDSRAMTLNGEALVLTDEATLKPVGQLVPGDRLAESGGGVAIVRACVSVQTRTTHPDMGGGDLSDGHLLDVLGLVVADLTLQTAAFIEDGYAAAAGFMADRIKPERISPDP